GEHGNLRFLGGVLAAHACTGPGGPESNRTTRRRRLSRSHRGESPTACRWFAASSLLCEGDSAWSRASWCRRRFRGPARHVRALERLETRALAVLWGSGVSAHRAGTWPSGGDLRLGHERFQDG